MNLLKYLLLPIQIIYSTIIITRNQLYDWGIIKTHKVKPIIISIGNLKNGGTGKTPLVEYIISNLHNKKIGVLSRGYGRKTNGFILAGENNNQSSQIGDENAQLYNKFSRIPIACDENRLRGIKMLLQKKGDFDCILLDDAYQHRRIHRDINILLTEYDKLLTNDQLMPIGDLREPKKEIKRANIIIITKCPPAISQEKKKEIINQLETHKEQKIYFSSIKKYYFKNMSNKKKYIVDNEKKYILITGIASSQKLTDYLSYQKIKVNHLKFRDHYNFTKNDLQTIIDLKKLNYSKDLLLTEKDYYRLSTSQLKTLNKHFTLICIQLEIEFMDESKSEFINQLLKFIK